MNERIKELAEEAHRQLVDEGDGDLSMRAFEGKFAELIVRECISMIENEAVQYVEPVWAFELVNDIKEHFGVE